MAVNIIVNNIYMDDELGPVVDTTSSSLEKYFSDNVPLKYFMTKVIHDIMIGNKYNEDLSDVSSSDSESSSNYKCLNIYTLPWDSTYTYTVNKGENHICLKKVYLDNGVYTSTSMLIKFHESNPKFCYVNDACYDVCFESKTEWETMNFITLCYHMVNMFNPNRMDNVVMYIPVNQYTYTKFSLVNNKNNKECEYWKVFEEYDYSDSISYFKKIDEKDLYNLKNINPNILDIPTHLDRSFKVLRLTNKLD